MQTEASTSLILPQVYSQPLSVFVGALPKTASEDKLSQFMSQFGYVKDVYISKDGASGGHYGFAFVNFAYVNHVDKLFGPHTWLGKQLEIKRSLQEYITLRGLPAQTIESDVAKAFQHLGYSISEVLIGGRIPGVPPGIAGVRLRKFAMQVQVAKLGTINILGKKVKMMQFIRKRSRRLLDNLDESQDLPIKANPRASMHLTSEPRSPTSVSPNFLSTGHSRASFSNSKQSAASLEVLDQQPEYFQLSPDLRSRGDAMPNSQSSTIGDRMRELSIGSPLSILQVPREFQPTSVCTCDWYQTCQNCFGVWPSRREIFISFFAFPGHL